MELNWPTFVLEIVNFLILVWILKRFLYKPALEAIARRRAAIEKILADAKAREADAQALEQQYRNRLADWEDEKEKLRVRVMEEIAAQRAQMMTALESELERERERARVLEQRRLNDLRNQTEEKAIAEGVQFTARLLARAAGPDLEAGLVNLVLEDLPLLPSARLQAIREVCGKSRRPAKVTSAFPLAASQRSAIAQALKDAIQDGIAVEFNEDARLVAGLRISAGPWVLHANIEDELTFFAEAVHHDSRKQ